MPRKSLRSRKNLSYEAFARKINRFSPYYAWSTEDIKAFENSEMDEATEAQLVRSIDSAFPGDINRDRNWLSPRKRGQGRNSSSAKIPFTEKHRRHLILLVFLATSLLALVIYYYFGLKDVISDTLLIVASVAGVLTFIRAIY